MYKAALGAVGRCSRAATMNAIKKQLQTLKADKELALERAEACERQAKEALGREHALREELLELERKLAQMRSELELGRLRLASASASLDAKEQSCLLLQSELAILDRRAQQCAANLEKSEERRGLARSKLGQALQSAEDAKRISRVLENRSKLDEERMDLLSKQLREARLEAEDADSKSELLAGQLALVEDELELVEERLKCTDAKIAEKEDKLFVVGNALKSLELSEDKANKRVDEFKLQLNSLKRRLGETEKRAVFAESSVKSYLAELDLREERLRKEKEKFKYMCDDLDSTFAELTSY